MKKLFFVFLLMFASLPSFGEELEMVIGKVYLMSFDSEIQNVFANNLALDAQILHTIFNDRKQLILHLKNDNTAILQVKTEEKLINYNVKASDKTSSVLTEIDFPPFENLDVDILGAE